MHVEPRSRLPLAQSPLTVGLGLAVALLLLVGWAPATAQANYGCWLGPNATCESPQNQAGQYSRFIITNYERAGCVRALGYYGEPVSSWHCFPKETVAYFDKPNPNGGWMRSALMNNNSSQPGWFVGGYDYAS
jgi:hypothetical protein